MFHPGALPAGLNKLGFQPVIANYCITNAKIKCVLVTNEDETREKRKIENRMLIIEYLSLPK